MGKASIPALRAETDILARMLGKLAPGEEITYDAMSAAIGKDVRKVRYLLSSARKRAERADGVATVCVYKRGLKRATGAEYAAILSRHRRTVRLTTRRRLQTSLLMPEHEYRELPDDQKTELNTERSMAGAMVHFARDKTAKRVEQSCANDRIAVGSVLELCK